MRTSSLLILGLALAFTWGRNSVSSGEEIEPLISHRKVRFDEFSVEKLRLTEAQALAIGRINGHLDLDAHIDCIETPLGDVIRHFLGGRGMIVAIDRAGFKKASVTLDQLVTYQPKEKQPLRKCLHEVFDPLGLDFVVFPDGLLITAAAEKAEK